MFLGAVGVMGMIGVSMQAALIPFEIEGEEATWQQVWHTSGANQNAPFTLVELQGKEWLHIGRGSLGTRTTGAFYTAGESSPTAANQFSDFSGSLVLMRGSLRPNAGRGIHVRSDSVNFTGLNRYSILVLGNGLGIYQGVGTTQESGAADWDGSPLAYTEFDSGVSFAANTQYYLQFSVIGDVIEADLFLYDGELEQVVGNSLAHVSYSNATVTDSGYIGLHGFYGGAQYASYYRNLDISVIPEVQHSLLLILGLVGISAVIKRKKAS